MARQSLGLRCPFGFWKKATGIRNEKAAGYVFACYDCAFLDSGQCCGYPCTPPPATEDIFSFIKFFEKQGLNRHEQGLALYAMGIKQVNGKPYAGDWISTFVWRKKHGKYIPPSFEHQFENDVEHLFNAMARS